MAVIYPPSYHTETFLTVADKILLCKIGALGECPITMYLFRVGIRGMSPVEMALRVGCYHSF